MLLPIILCGGSGTRLWPLSRENYPKQFLSLIGEQTMLQQTATRLRALDSSIVQSGSPVLVCNEEHRFLAAGQLLEAGIKRATILLEPVARNTAPALTLAALHATADGADPIMLAMPADHVVLDLPAFHRAVQTAYEAASQGQVVTFGASPQYPESGYGYIQYEPMCGRHIFEVKGFTEKPSPELARKYVQAGTYLWNCGIFMLRASTWLKAIGCARLEILQSCQSAMAKARQDLDFVRPNEEEFYKCPADSIDYAVMEKLRDHPEWGIASSVVPLEAGWSDIGAWDALWKLSERDARGNAVSGASVVHHGCDDTLLMSSNRLVAAIGLQNLIVIETPDAVLVADKNHTQEVKRIVACLAQDRSTLAQQHRKVHRPWGWYDQIDRGDRFQVKRIVVNPGASLSLQIHQYRAEHWVVVKGVAEVTHGEQQFMLKENESTYIPIGHPHRLHNPGHDPLEIIEIQSGNYLGEDDIVRLDDAYGRASQRNQEL